jgi:hypothetical protein
LEKLFFVHMQKLGKWATALKKEASERGADQLSGFSTSSVHVGFVVDRVALGLGFFY